MDLPLHECHAGLQTQLDVALDQLLHVKIRELTVATSRPKLLVVRGERLCVGG